MPSRSCEYQVQGLHAPTPSLASFAAAAASAASQGSVLAGTSAVGLECTPAWVLPPMWQLLEWRRAAHSPQVYAVCALPLWAPLFSPLQQQQHH